MIVFDCPSCRAELEADLEFAGATIECPSCHHSAVVPVGAIARDSLVAGYRIERHLGGGNLGEVYVATQLSVERQVALKILPPALAQQAALTAAFLREARALARVDHPGVVAVLDAGSDSGCFYLSTPLIEGEDLAHRVERQGRLSEAEAVHVGLEIARVLSSCWDRFAAAHLDLKPANVMVDTDGHVRLLDFGLTGHLFSDPDHLATVRHLLLTPFVSPEQLEGRGDLDFRSDLYALGACLFYLTTGRSPYQESAADELISRIQNQQIPSARKANPALSAPFDQLIASLTVKDPHRRPAGWDQVIDALEGMEKSQAAPPPRRGGTKPRLLIPRPVAAAPAHVIKLKPSAHIPHHQVVAQTSSMGPWIVGIVIVAMLAVGITLKVRSLRHRAAAEAIAAAAAASNAPPVRSAADLVQDVRLFIETFKNDIEGGRTQIRGARETILSRDANSPLAAELDQLELTLNERERRAAPQPEPVAKVTNAAPVVAADPEAPKANPLVPLYQSAARLLERDFTGAGALLPAADDPVEGVDVAALRKELADLSRWTDLVYVGLRELIGREQELAFRDGPRALLIKAVSPPLIRTEKVVRDGERVIGRSSGSFRLEDLSTEELLRQIHGERGGTPALTSGLICYRAGKLSDARAWFNRTTSPWAPLLVRSMDGDPVAAP